MWMINAYMPLCIFNSSSLTLSASLWAKLNAWFVGELDEMKPDEDVEVVWSDIEAAEQGLLYSASSSCAG